MSMLDKVVAAVMPAESGTARLEARAKARAAAKPGDWLSLVLDHHIRIEDAFAAVRAAPAALARLTALKSLALILTGHSNAEESVIYPALARAGHSCACIRPHPECASSRRRPPPPSSLSTSLRVAETLPSPHPQASGPELAEVECDPTLSGESPQSLPLQVHSRRAGETPVSS